MSGASDSPDIVDDAFFDRLKSVHRSLDRRKSLSKNLSTVEADLLDLLDARLVTVYQCVNNGHEILATYKGGADIDKAVPEIRVSFSPNSIAGYVALSQRPVLVPDVQDKDYLLTIHPRLKTDDRFSAPAGLDIASMVAVPIKDNILLGVLQVMNLRGDRAFTRTDLLQVRLVGEMLAKQLRPALKSTQTPFDYLVQQKLISAEELSDIERRAPLYGGSVTRILSEDHGIKDEDLGKSLEYYYRVPYLGYESDRELPEELMEDISRSYLRKNLWLPIDGSKEEAVILIDDPSDYQRIMEIQGLMNAESYSFRVSTAEHILHYLDDSSGDTVDLDIESVIQKLGDQLVEVETVEADADDASLASTNAIIQLVNSIVIDSARLGASDIHIEPGKGKADGVARVRVDGLCRELHRIPNAHVAAVVARIKVMSRLDISERRLPQDGKCKLRFSGKTLELRVATVPTVNGESAVLRILASGDPMPLEKMGFSDAVHNEVLSVSRNPYGLFLVVGPTGSGKTTTLHAVLAHMNTPDKKIWTAEDPVEITQPGLQQVQMHPRAGLTFATALRAFLRADPDVILIGEMRDHETASIGIEASLTGHIVLSTLHTNSAPETVTRLLDLGLDPVNFSDALLGILAQRLMRTLCKACKEAYQPDETELNHLIENYGEAYFDELGIDTSNVTLYRAVGCDECSGSGYSGRIGIHELLRGTNNQQRLIYNRASLDEIREQAMKDGMRTLKQDAIRKVFAGYSDYSQLLRVVSD